MEEIKHLLDSSKEQRVAYNAGIRTAVDYIGILVNLNFRTAEDFAKVGNWRGYDEWTEKGIELQRLANKIDNLSMKEDKEDESNIEQECI